MGSAEFLIRRFVTKRISSVVQNTETWRGGRRKVFHGGSCLYPQLTSFRATALATN